VPLIHHEFAWPGKTVLHEGVLGNGLYMIGRGFAKKTFGGRLRELLTTTDFFGEGSLLVDAPAAFTVQTLTLCQFEVLAKKEFVNVLTLYPQVKRMLQRYATHKAKQDRHQPQHDDISSQLAKVEMDLQQNANYYTKEGKEELRKAMADLVEQTRSRREGKKDGVRTGRRSSWLLSTLTKPSDRASSLPTPIRSRGGRCDNGDSRPLGERLMGAIASVRERTAPSVQQMSHSVSSASSQVLLKLSRKGESGSSALLDDRSVRNRDPPHAGEPPPCACKRL